MMNDWRQICETSFTLFLSDAPSVRSAPAAGLETCPRNERGAGPRVETAWRYLRLRACEVTSNAPSAGEPRFIIPSRPTFLSTTTRR